MSTSPTSSAACASHCAAEPAVANRRYCSGTSARSGHLSSTGPVASRTLSTACGPRNESVACLRTAGGSARSMRSASIRSTSDQGEAGRTGALLRTYAVPEAATPAKAMTMANSVRSDPSSVIAPAKAEEVEDLIRHRGRQRHFEDGIGATRDIVGIREIGDAFVDAAELGVPALARHVLAAVAERVGAGDGDERPGLAQAAQRQAYSRVGIAARERDAARRLRAGEHHRLWTLDAGLARRTDRAVELPEGSLAAQSRQRLACFLRAAVQLLHPLFAESEGRGKIQPAAVGRGRRRELRTAQLEEPAHRGGDFIGALAGAHRAEAVLHGMLVQRVAICRPQAPADLARGQQMIPADQRLRNLIEDARPALDEDLVADDRGDALLDVPAIEHLAEHLR